MHEACVRSAVAGVGVNYREWHLPIRRETVTLREAKDSLKAVAAGQQEIPLMVQLVENPKYKIPGITLFHGAVDLDQHDNIHILLGRGLLEMDEAFTIGFTMGSTSKVTTAEETLFTLVARYLYPSVYQFGDDDIAVFKDAVRLGYISSSVALDQVDFAPHMDRPLGELRAALGIETRLLLAYYEIEKQRYPDSVASQRLLDD